MRRSILIVLFSCCLAAEASAQACRDIATYEGSVRVRQTADGIVTFRANVDVNTDGALQSYRADDLGFIDPKIKRLNTRSALNTICNGVNIRNSRNGLVFNFRSCTALIREFQRIRDFGWHRAGENYVEFYAIAGVPGTTRPGRNRYTPCERDGFYVSHTARAIDPKKGVCDPDRWVDALRISAIVLPLDAAMKRTGIALHDLAIVRLPGTQTWIGAIVGDTNPSKIGEGTVILAMRLRGQTAIPGNYRQTLALALPAAEYFVFPRTASLIPNLSNASDVDIQKQAKLLYDKHKLAERTRLCP